ncbi:GroES-like protein [Meira miltonrushii]|uniref:GroES-like protein n=1 Tax=Meira miltonrushii TaxID=1280837 RepID=A0A316VMC8_9BASI|nr:GroES-like protein [Meira miltonrushii]PWN37251.1 GroES-like protein [Meira miltonrushii]
MLKSTMLAITAGKEDGIAIVRKDIPIPTPNSGQVLVRIIYAGQNPPDAYALDKQRSAAYFDPDFILGSDLSGIVVESKSDNVPIGARICAWVPGNTSVTGAYAEYVVCDAEMVICVPANLSLRLAAALPFSFFTALHGLQVGLGLQMDKMDTERTPVLIWGAGTACGYYASQLLHLAGYEVIAVAGQKSKYQLEAVGVNNFYPRDNLDQAIDKSLDACVRCMKTEASAHIHTLLPAQPSVTKLANLKITFDLVHTMTGKSLPILSMVQPAHTADHLALHHEIAVEWSKYDKGLLYKMLQKNQIKILPITVWREDALANSNVKERIESIKEALEFVANGSAFPNGKIVHHIQDIQQRIEHLLGGP